ncbi:MAG: hypothetical protein CMI12_14605 [Oceanospirillum sp.]|nr:hypothetical protein [Oceanospirillum sp.]
MKMIDRGAVLARYVEDAPPLRVKELIRELGIEIETKRLRDNESAHIRFDFDEGKYVIAVDEDHHVNRKNFSMAHELGHFFLHRGFINDEPLQRQDYYAHLSDEERAREIEANQFAANLLVSNGALKKFLADKCSVTLAELSDAFEVSQVVMKIRLRSFRTHNPISYNKISNPEG